MLSAEGDDEVGFVVVVFVFVDFQFSYVDVVECLRRPCGAALPGAGG